MLSPAQIMERLEQIDRDLAERQNEYEDVAEKWTHSKRTREKVWAEAYISSVGKQVTDRKAAAILASELIGVDEEARFVGLKGVVDVLQTRSMIGQSLLKAHGRIG